MPKTELAGQAEGRFCGEFYFFLRIFFYLCGHKSKKERQQEWPLCSLSCLFPLFSLILMTSQIIQWVLENLNYWVVTLFMAIESSFIPFPSEVVVPPAAWLAMAGDSMNIFLVVVAATLGADIGALVNYFLARWLGRPIVYKFANSRLGHMCLIDAQKVEHAEQYFLQHGAASTFFGRLIPAVRQLISIPAGLAGMKLGPFLLYTTLGAGFWNSILAAIGFGIYQWTPLKTTADVSDLATKYSHEIGYAILALAALALAYIIYKGWSKK